MPQVSVSHVNTNILSPDCVSGINLMMRKEFDYPGNSVSRAKLTEADKINLSLLYDKYAGIMYGNILQITNDKVLAEEIFIKAFLSIKDDKHFVLTQHSLSLFVCMFAKRFTHAYIKELTVADTK